MAGSADCRLKSASKNRSWIDVEKPRRSAQAAIARVFLIPTNVASVRMDVLSVDAVTVSMSCNTRLRSCAEP